MKQRILLIMFIISCLPSVTFGQAAKLEGYVFDHKNNPVANVRIVALPGQATLTDSIGHFTVIFPAAIHPGQAIRIQVAKPGWVVYTPLFGECVTQSATRNYEPLKVVIVPKGSPLVLSSGRMSQITARLADEYAKRNSITDPKRNFDEYAFLREYAEKYGLKLESLKAALDQWAKANDANDLEERALKEYWLGNYETAARLAGQALPTALERVKYERIEASRKVIRLYTLKGTAHYEQSNFQEALSAYREVEKRFDTKELSKEDFKEEWAETKLLLGNTRRELGARTEGEESRRFLLDALRNYEEALSVYIREHVPHKWAVTQNNLGSVLSLLGERQAGSEGESLLNRAIEAFYQAFQVFSREQAPQDWATTQNNLGVTFRALGERLDKESIGLLRQAIEAFRQALTVRTREQQPREWAATQNNLGVALQALGERVDRAEGIKHLNEAVAAYRAAQEVRTREWLPQDWAATQNNLGVVLQDLAEQTRGAEGVKYLDTAIATYRQVLTIRTREQQPQDWAATQNNLGTALMAQASQVIGEERIHLLNGAVQAYNLALEVRTQKQLPQQWVVTQNNLARAYLLLKNWKEAAGSYENVLNVYPNFQEAYKSLAMIYHEQLFEYEKAFQLHQRWLSQLPDDVDTLADFTETHFTTGRFREFSERNRSLLTTPSVPSAKIALKMIEVANLLALDKAEEVPDSMATLMKTVGEQEPNFRIVWSFGGTLHFINQREELRIYRPWLTEFFRAATGENRDAILKALRESQSQFRPYRR